MKRITARVTVDLTMIGEDVAFYHPSYFGRVIEAGIQRQAETRDDIATWQIVESVIVEE